jgi:hypothetical protein
MARKWSNTSFSFFFLAVLGFELRASHLLGRHFTTEIFVQSMSMHVIIYLFLRSSCVTQLSLLESVYRMFQKDDLLSNVTRQAFVDRSLLTLLWHCNLDALREFFSKIVVDAIDMLKSRFTKVSYVLLNSVSMRMEDLSDQVFRDCCVFSQVDSCSRKIPFVLITTCGFPLCWSQLVGLP